MFSTGLLIFDSGDAAAHVTAGHPIDSIKCKLRIRSHDSIKLLLRQLDNIIN